MAIQSYEGSSDQAQDSIGTTHCCSCLFMELEGVINKKSKVFLHINLGYVCTSHLVCEVLIR